MAHYITDASGKLMKVSGNEYSNLDCLKTEVIYDMNDHNKQLGQPNGILVGSSVSSNFSKYDRLKVYCQGAGEVSSRIYEIDLSRPATSVKVSGYPYMGVGTDTSFDDIANNASSVGIYFDISLVNADKTTFMHYRAGYTIGSTPTYRDSYYGTYHIYKIEGIFKQPAMIYTGKELFAGNGISVKDGVVSSAPAIIDFKTSSEFKITQSATVVKVPFSTSTVSSNASGKLVAQSDGSVKIGSGVSLVKVSVSTRWYINTLAQAYLYISKNDGYEEYVAEQLKDSSYRFIPITIAPILISVTDGDVISIKVQSTAGTNNSIMNARYLVEVVE